jgi:hypothetical protein
MTHEAPMPEDRLYDEERDGALLSEARREPLDHDVQAESDALGNDHGVLGASEAAMDLRTRWDVIQRSFVDDPRNAVSDADSLVDEVMRRLSDSFTEQLRKLESEWHESEPSTEDLRSALMRYRTIFQRLLDV